MTAAHFTLGWQRKKNKERDIKRRLDHRDHISSKLVCLQLSFLSIDNKQLSLKVKQTKGAFTWSNVFWLQCKHLNLE